MVPKRERGHIQSSLEPGILRNQSDGGDEYKLAAKWKISRSSDNIQQLGLCLVSGATRPHLSTSAICISFSSHNSSGRSKAAG